MDRFFWPTMSNFVSENEEPPNILLGMSFINPSIRGSLFSDQPKTGLNHPSSCEGDIEVAEWEHQLEPKQNITKPLHVISDMVSNPWR